MVVVHIQTVTRLIDVITLVVGLVLYDVVCALGLRV
jgi:hypothetical protein